MPASAFQTQVLVALQCEGDAFKNQSAAYWEVETTQNYSSGSNDSQAFLSHLDTIDWMQLP